MLAQTNVNVLKGGMDLTVQYPFVSKPVIIMVIAHYPISARAKKDGLARNARYRFALRIVTTVVSSEQCWYRNFDSDYNKAITLITLVSRSMRGSGYMSVLPMGK